MDLDEIWCWGLYLKVWMNYIVSFKYNLYFNMKLRSDFIKFEKEGLLVQKWEHNKRNIAPIKK
jgi:hypothetical protein